MYIAKVLKFPFNKKYRCKGHKVLAGGIVMLILETEERVFVPTKFIIEFDDGWFKMELNEVIKDSQGKAVVEHGLKR